MADAPGSSPGARKGVWVQVPPIARKNNMDTINKIAGRHFNYNCKGGFSCTCPGCAGPTRTRIAEMVTHIDRTDPTNREQNRSDQRSHSRAKTVSRDKRSLMRRAKRKESRFAMTEAMNES